MAIIKEKLEDAKRKQILIDLVVTDRATNEMIRLEKERNLRFYLE